MTQTWPNKAGTVASIHHPLLFRCLSWLQTSQRLLMTTRTNFFPFPLQSARHAPLRHPVLQPLCLLYRMAKSTGTHPTAPRCRIIQGNPPAHGSSRFLAPPLTASTSSLSLPRTSECSCSDLTEDPPRAPSPHILDSFPPLTRGQQTWCSLEPSHNDPSEKISQSIPSNSSRSPQPSTPVCIPSRSVSTDTTSSSTSPLRCQTRGGSHHCGYLIVIAFTPSK